MARFHELFLLLAPGADPADRKVRESELSRTEMVPVPDIETAVKVAASDDFDLIELYGGLGPKAAAAVVAATENVPVGLVGVEYAEPPRNLVVIFEAPSADPEGDRYVFRHGNGQVTVVAVPGVDVVPTVAATLVARGADRVELCGGMGPVPTAAVLAEVGDRVPVTAVLFGFESLLTVAAYRTRFEEAAGIS